MDFSTKISSTDWETLKSFLTENGYFWHYVTNVQIKNEKFKIITTKIEVVLEEKSLFF